MIHQNQLKSLLIKKIKKNLNQNEKFVLYLFGSYAWGKPNEGSDIDLLLVSADDNDPHFLVKKLYKSFADIE
ncbi:MAG: nucleotidyltransferase domain-containing protein, partial [Candidatus Margulisiibacteriota bacterium]